LKPLVSKPKSRKPEPAKKEKILGVVLIKLVAKVGII
jgi:hypothetical protein